MASAGETIREGAVDESRLWSKEPSTHYVPHHDTDFSQFRQIFPIRRGTRPSTTDNEPHEQLDQLGPEDLYHELKQRCFALPGVTEMDSLISFPESRALILEKDAATGPPEAWVWSENDLFEFAHIHPFPDSSMHLNLPLEVAVVAISAGWAEPHALIWQGFTPAHSVMVYSPRDEQDLESVWALVEESYNFATGQPQRLRIEPQPID